MTARTWFITGVNSGFGREMTEQLLRRGDRVAGTVRKLDAVADLKDTYGDRFLVAHLDVTDTAEIKTVVDKAFAELGTVDVVVNNAGYGLFGAAEELTDAQIDHIIATNLTGSIHVTRAALPHLRAQQGGRIIQISTFGGQAAFPGASMYHATKWAVEGFTEAVAHEVAGFGIGVTIIEPGGARTQFRYGSAQLGPALDAYADTLVAAVRAMLESGTALPPGDPARMASVIIASTDQNPAPLRIALGTDSFGIIRTSLTDRLAALEAQQDVATSTDFPAGE
ncbi:SDR family oxidoreductase [Streptomyces sp. SID3212]|uniref:SDR family oxidoreductase n=1 Tax=Streptomyces sp. SID3212 TaxID=2690259 RepID=UPI001370F176|nr:SDR family oxidoreductase [Streptomyces sp. SID3212]MYV54599.1 SDR family oxidoreductase [Streptomyces sp. SID3212]